MAAKRRAQDVGDQNQYLVAIQVPKAVVHQLEVVDVYHRQPLLHGISRCICVFFHGSDGLGPLAGFIGGKARELLVESLAVEQAGQRVAFAVVQQALVVLVDVKDAGDDVELLCGKGARLDDFKAGRGFVMHPDGEPQAMAPPAQGCGGPGRVGRDAFLQGGQFCNGLARGVLGRFGFVGHPFAVAHPGAWAHEAFAAQRKDIQGAHLYDGTHRLQGRQHRHLQPQVIPVAGHLNQVLQNGFHGLGMSVNGRRSLSKHQIPYAMSQAQTTVFKLGQRAVFGLWRKPFSGV